jgi:SpoVK/Ycf46/Vps4 family AAA+-type ATPase
VTQAQCLQLQKSCSAVVDIPRWDYGAWHPESRAGQGGYQRTCRCWLLATASRAQPEESIKELAELGQNDLLLFPVATPCREARGWRQDLRNGGTSGLNRAIEERRLDEGAGLLGPQALDRDDPVEFGFAPDRHESVPLLIDGTAGGHGADEVLDEVFLVTQGGAGVDGPGDRAAEFPVVPVAAFFPVLLHEHEDVVDVDLDLLDELNLEDHVLVDRLLLCFGFPAKLCVEVEVDAAVVLGLPLRQDLVAGELVERGQDVLQPRTVSAAQGVTNEMLKLIPPFREQDERLLICATNSVRALDSAFLRHGRFDYVIPVGPPDAAAREAIWDRYLAAIPHSELDMAAIVEASRLFTPADIEFAARRTAQLTFERVLFEHGSEEVITKDILHAIGQTRRTLTPELVSEFERDIQEYARV